MRLLSPLLGVLFCSALLPGAPAQSLSGFDVATFGRPRLLVEHLPEEATVIASADLDMDGDADFYVGTFFSITGGATADALLLGEPGPRLVDASDRLINSTPRATADVAIADLDGDGLADILTRNMDGPVTLLRNLGGGMFLEDASATPGTVDDTRALALADLQLDGDLDAWIGNTGQDRILLNNGAALFSDLPSGIPLDGARSDDVVFLAQGGSTGVFAYVCDAVSGNRLLGGDLADTNPVFSALPGSLPPGKASEVSAADIDGDRYDDVIIGIQLDGPGGTFEQKSFLYGNDGSGRFVDRTDELGFDFTLFHDVELADIEGDGDLDAILGGHSDSDGTGAGVLLKRNDGAAGFVTANGQIQAAFNETNAVALGDVDLDGDVDILQSNEILYDGLLINDGFGNFDFDATLFPPVIEDTYDALLLDADGDGDLDALSAGAGQIRLARNDGTGLLADDTASLPFAIAGALSMGDLEGDGDLDVVLSTTGVNWLWRNDLTGFVALAPGPGPSSVPVDILFADLDANGAPDVLFSGQASAFGPFESRLLWNDGTGDFTISDQALPEEVGRASALVTGDLDGDGDVDVMANATPLFNLGRQLAARGPAALGKDLLLVVNGKPGAPFLVVNANTEVEVPIGALGVLRLDPGSLSLLATGSVGSEGSTVLQIALPADLALLGQTGLAQAGIGYPLRLSNLERVVFTDL
ncbi:MAG: hypothetical protein ACI8QS_000355 [Planctomycetota bacterium]|jgi:hypothetical protein